ncbi:hypothetical protein CHU32_02750 [Superficieibacter electus]|uniref:Uncharacterized protein n=1 Tax=Superficieibacter electus TaxID=2022662 RepID=A0A2P5GUY3_9ENTR|nr:hypothetical protein CHU33_12860 [Superficieibacter electus]POP50361.1 hypothetical protein CHU32_02750 [Superficieibacter electus]
MFLRVFLLPTSRLFAECACQTIVMSSIEVLKKHLLTFLHNYNPAKNTVWSMLKYIDSNV